MLIIKKREVSLSRLSLVQNMDYMFAMIASSKTVIQWINTFFLMFEVIGHDLSDDD